MCWQMALGIASTAAQFAAQSEAANQQNRYYAQNAMATNTDAVEKYAQEQLARIQEEAKATQERLNTRTEVTKAKGTALASSENGGVSENQVLRDMERQGAKQSNVVSVNEKNMRNQSKANVDAINREAQGRIDSVRQGSQPSLLSAVVSGLGGTIGYMDNKTKNPKDVASTGSKP